MSRESLESFRALIWEDAAQMRSLREIEDRAEFAARLIEVGRAFGFVFDSGDIEVLMRDNHLWWMQRWA